jgi:leucyl aminopeptidase
MKIVLGSAKPQSQVDVLVVLVTESGLARDEVVDELDKTLGGGLRPALKDDEWTGKKDAQFSVVTLRRGGPRRVALFGLGAAEKVTPADVRAAVARAARLANGEKATSLTVVLPKGADAATVRAAAEGATLGAYRFKKYLTGDRAPKKELHTVTLVPRGAGRKDAAWTDAIAAGAAVAEAVNLTRDLVNEPPNVMTPAALADAASEVARKHKLKATVLDMKAIRARGMKLLEAVGRGSANEPRLVHVAYVPPKARKGRKRVVIVGKGLTFDSGGLCIKPAPGMGDMKSDMAGAAVSIGVMAAVAALRPDVEVHSVFAAAENMPDGDAYRPGDIFGSLDGKSVEIINTDAEGRLVLADALAYARELKPDALIDHATLTGAIVIALGPNTAGFYSNDDALAEAYLGAAKDVGEAMWRMPLIEELRDQLKSDVADLKHTGERSGGSITAALFLREFIGDARWIHIDIAGPALAERPTPLSPKGGTGFGVLTAVAYIERLALA